MSHRKNLWLRAAAPAAVLALTLTACGSDDSNSSGAGSGSDQGQEQDTDQDEDPAEDDSAGDDDATEGSGGSLALGETAGPLPYEYSEAAAELEVTVQKLDIGDIADVEALDIFDPEDLEGTTPMYLYTDYAHVGGEDLEYARPSLEQSARLATGQFMPSVIMIGSMDIPGGCPAAEDPRTFAEGDVWNDCKMYLVPDGSELTEVAWTAADDAEYTWALN
ncbi:MULTISPECIES: hypothetical protein [Streptomyces]|uniref:hypothetical protein n=1 Tax=Streptomyces TaxID=1883 RepID=UPI0019035F24|nr:MULTISPECIES: hypothetical protein [unclassified Streptomyces]MCU4745733.1 hypothetical protein [Streptomyces sp. G-5]QQN79299.1 hypothetical protein IPZ77_19070 [Streptomyces sp. XC 2026]